jgi:lipid-A-disaccharide synthase
MLERPETDTGRPTVFVSAGELSGDLHGAAFVRALRERVPGVRIIGLGGPQMEQEGVELLAHASDLAVMGFAEVFGRLPFFMRLKRRIWSLLERERIDLVVPIDYPGFNLRLAEHAHSLRIPVLYFIAPQVWAWHASRAKKLSRFADHIAVILPFEEEFFRDAGARCSFVGHPLLDAQAPAMPREEWAAQHALDPERPILAVFPGSRQQEIDRHLELFLAAVDRVVAARPDVQPVVGVAASLDPAAFGGVPWPRVPGDSGLLWYATAALVKSGTTTLETALAGTPLVVAYRMNPLSYALARRLVRVPHVALANLVADKRVVPELIQDEATPDTLCAALLPLLDPGSERRAQMMRELAEIRGRLGDRGAAGRVAEIAATLLSRKQA